MAYSPPHNLQHFVWLTNPERMKVLLYGGQGWIGKQFSEHLSKQNIEFILGKSRVDDLDAVSREIDGVKPTHVVSMIGRTHGKIGDKTYSTIDYLEQKGRILENVRDNLFSPVSLAIICEKASVHFTYLGTGCIFTYDETHPFGKDIDGFSEDDTPNFFGSGYSVVKGFTDRLMKNFENSTLNLRIRMPITASPNPRNFITKITSYEKICSVPNSMTVLPDMLPLVVDMMVKNKTGTYNLTNPGLISHNEMLEMYKDVVDPNFTWKNFNAEEQAKVLDSARSNNYLETTKLIAEYPEVPDIMTSVRRCLEIYKIEKQHATTVQSQIEKIPSTTLMQTVVSFPTKINLLLTGGCGLDPDY